MTLNSSSAVGISAKRVASISSSEQVVISSGRSKLILTRDGTVIIRGTQILLEADADVELKAGASFSVLTSSFKVE